MIQNHYWIVAGDEARAWSSAQAAYVAVTDETYQAWLAAGGIPSRIVSEQELTDVLKAYDLAGPLPVPRLVPKSLIVQRLIDTGKIAAANTALEADPAKKARWYAADHPAIRADDADANAFLQAIGADPAAILAP